MPSSNNPGDNGSGDFNTPGPQHGNWSNATWPSGGTLRAKLRTIASAPISNYDILQEVEDIVRGIGEAGAAGVVAAEGEAAVEVGTAVVGAVAAFCGIDVLIVVLLIIAALLLIEAAMYNIAGFIPLSFGHKAQLWVRAHFAWLNNIESAIGDKIVQMAAMAGNQWIALIRTVLVMEGVLPTTNTKTVVKYTDKQVQDEVLHMQRQIQYLYQHIGSVEYITQDKKVVVGIPQNVWDDIHELQRQMQTLRQDITSLQTQVDKAQHDAQSANNRIGDVTATIHEVRAISVGWSDIQHTLDDLGTRITHIQNTTDERLDHVLQVQTQMQPLTLLQGAGVRGLRTLRQLEDTPCMCPKPPHINTEFANALAMYEFITNG